MTGANFKPLLPSILFVLSIIVSMTGQAVSSGHTCDDLLSHASNSESSSLKSSSHESVSHLLKTVSKLENGPLTINDALPILADQDLPFYGQILTETLEQAEGPSLKAFKKALRHALKRRLYSDQAINARIAMIDSPGKKSWRTILGDLSLKETHRMFYGRDYRHPSPDSLVGKYIANTGAQTRLIRFDTHNEKHDLGPLKLVVAVSSESWQALQDDALKSSHYMAIVGHAATMYNGLFYPNEGGKGAKQPRLPRMNELLPLMLMKTTEAQRFARYTQMTADPKFNGWHDGLKKPWVNESYCATGAYSCCTHWIGNIPIGDKLVSKYTFPANWEVEGGDRTPITGRLRPFTPAPGKEELATVWKVPGHQQLADVIGQHESNVKADMASPGSVQMVFYARTGTDRVPIVFWVTEDHRAAIPETLPFFTEPLK